MAFPGSSTAVYVYELHVPLGERLKDFTLANLHEVMKEHGLWKSNLPPNGLNGLEGEVWRWAWPDDENPVNIDRFVAWTMRRWKKMVPTDMIRAKVADHKRQLTDDGHKEKDLHESLKVYREAITDELTRRQLPKLSRETVVIDTKNQQVFLYAGSEKVRESILERLRAVLRPMLNDKLFFVHRNLDAYLNEYRRHSSPPAATGGRMLQWLVSNIQKDHQLRIPVGDEVIGIKATLGNTVKIQRLWGENETVQLKGNDLVHSWARHQFNGEETHEEVVDGWVTEIELDIFIHNPVDKVEERSWTVKLSAQGELMACKQLEDVTADDTGIDSAYLIAADDYQAAHEMVWWLFRAFDHLELSNLLREEQQQQMYPGKAEPWNAVWTTEEGLPVEAGSTPLEREVTAMKKALKDAGTTVDIALVPDP